MSFIWNLISLCTLILLVAISIALLYLNTGVTVSDLNNNTVSNNVFNYNTFDNMVPGCPDEPYYDLIPSKLIHKAFSEFAKDLNAVFRILKIKQKMHIFLKDWFNSCSIISNETLLNIKMQLIPNTVKLNEYYHPSLMSLCQCQFTYEQAWKNSVKDNLIKILTNMCLSGKYKFPEASIFIFNHNDNILSPNAFLRQYPRFGDGLFNTKQDVNNLLFVPRSYFNAYKDKQFVYNKLNVSYINWENKTTNVLWRGSCSGSPSFCTNYTLFEGNYNSYIDIESGIKCSDIDYGYCNISNHPLLNRWNIIDYNVQNKWNKEIINMMDIGMIDNWCDDKRDYYKSTEYFSKSITRKEMLKYKFIINMDGNSVADRFPYQLKYGSVILKQSSPNVEFWYYHLKNGTHFISWTTPQQLNDILTRWKNVNFSKAQQIGRQAGKLIQKHYLNETVLGCFASNMLNYYTSSLKQILQTNGI